MGNIEFNQGVSFKIFLDHKNRADHTRSVFLRVIIDRKKREFNLNVHWPKEFFDARQERALPRFARDKDVNAINLVIDEAKGRSNRIKLRYFTDGRLLTLDMFAKEFDTYNSRENFLPYMENKIAAASAIGRISGETAIRHNTQLGRLRRFNGGDSFLSMSEVTTNFIIKYQDWLAKKGGEQKDSKPRPLSYNTVVNAIKTFQTYFNDAKKEGFKVPDAFGNVEKNVCNLYIVNYKLPTIFRFLAFSSIVYCTQTRIPAR